jgi:hypothetical protein
MISMYVEARLILDIFSYELVKSTALTRGASLGVTCITSELSLC